MDRQTLARLAPTVAIVMPSGASMDDVLDKHKQDFNEIRRLCLLCHGLDLTSSLLFTGSSYTTPSENTKSAMHSLLSSHMLNLAVAIRINLYQKNIDNSLISKDTMAVGYYEDDLVVKSATIKDVCDKIIHAESVTKPILPKWLLDGNTKISFQLKGTHNKKSWTLDLCLSLFVEKILAAIDELEAS
jgi:hypothetical protein